MRKLILLLSLVTFVFTNYCFTQPDSTLSVEQLEQYTEQSKQLISYLEGTLNFLGDPDELPSEKDIIFNQSYLKMFVNDEVQIEDDLDENREIPLNKDVQAYLKDIDFFFKKAEFKFEIEKIDQLVTDSNIVVFKLSLNRQLHAVAIDGDTIINNQLRFIEINLDPYQKDLKIASIYTTKIREKEELRYWWNTMSTDWKDFFGKSVVVYDTLPFKNIVWFSDSSVVTMIRTEEVMIDTAIIVDDGITDPPLWANDSTIVVYDTVVKIIPDTILVTTNTIYRLLKTFRNIEKIDLSNNLNIGDINPLSELSELSDLNLSNTIIEDLNPIRNLKKLETINCSGSAVSTLTSLRYINSLKEIDISNTMVSSIDIFSNLTELNKVNLSSSSVTNIKGLAKLEKLTHLNASKTNVTDISPLDKNRSLSDLNISNTQIISLTSLDSVFSLQNLNIDSTNISNLLPLSKCLGLSILQANSTKVSDLSSLSNLEDLKVIYCDNSNVDMTEANDFMDNNPHCLVIYNSQELVSWWNNLNAEWQDIFKTSFGISNPVTKEKLHDLISKDELSVANNKRISSLEPIRMLHRLEYLNIQNTGISNLDPLSGLNNLEFLNLNNTDVVSLEPLSLLHNLKQISFEQTEIDNLTPLLGSGKLELVYCDKSGVTSEVVLNFINQNNSCLVIYQSEKLRMWWNNMDTEWQSTFSTTFELPSNPSNEQLQTLVNMTKLSVDNNMLLSSLNPLHMFLRLEELSVNNTSITDISPILSLVTLRKLNFSKNPISEVESISKLIGLNELVLENTSIEDLEPISKLTNLKTLNIAGTKIKSLKYMERLSNLEKLYINNTRVRNLKQLNNLSNLTFLQCYNTSIKASKIDSYRLVHTNTEVVYY